MLDISNCDLPDLKQLENGDVYYKCGECRKYIRVNQVLRKEIDESRDLLTLIYYCRTCDLYYFKFKPIKVK